MTSWIHGWTLNEKLWKAIRPPALMPEMELHLAASAWFAMASQYHPVSPWSWSHWQRADQEFEPSGLSKWKSLSPLLGFLIVHDISAKKSSCSTVFYRVFCLHSVHIYHRLSDYPHLQVSLVPTYGIRYSSSGGNLFLASLWSWQSYNLCSTPLTWLRWKMGKRTETNEERSLCRIWRQPSALIVAQKTQLAQSTS